MRWRIRQLPPIVAAMTLRAPALKITATILILWCAGLGAAGQFSKIGVPFAELQALFPQSGAAVGLLLSLVSLVGALFGLVAGAMALRIGLRRGLIGALILGGAISLIQAQMTTLGPLLVSRIFEGISHLMIVIAAPTLIAQITPERFRGLTMTLWATFFGVAYAATAWFGTGLAQNDGLAALFRLHGAWLIAVAAMLWFLLPTVAPGRGRAEAPVDLIGDIRRAVHSPRIAAPGLGWLFYTLTFVSLLAILPGLIPAPRRAEMIGTLPLISILSSLAIVPVLLRRLSAVQVIQIGFLGAAVSAALMAVTPDPSLPAMSLFTALGVIQGASFAAVPELNRTIEDRALSNGLLAQMGNLGNLLGTPLLLLMLGRTGPGGLVGGIVLAYLLAMICHGWMARRRARGAG
ncbi:Predicted arabinose efflux permease, MFS family [Paracoccus isoporae]|uniref:Predicted arabinose efflux permease, MFS family n=2 Tax=Paracoccus isoporae TaxID=591205 RepID=A0A1G7GIJ9_9RHOB|nr:Predicted arabinose efflux permease, MFS family [Paracoccus isoporae]